MDEPSGVLIVNKPACMTSHDVVNKIRKIYGIKRVGHTGTLDPIATGVLVVLIGRAAKVAEFVVNDIKKYRARFQLGITTDTGDITGKIISTSDNIPPIVNIKDKFKGAIKQVPPMYSAIKIGGQKLVDLARQGIEVEREAREIFIHELDITHVDANVYELITTCSKGTYIRTLCEDIGAELGCGATMVSLVREMNGVFTLADSYALEEIERSKPLIPVEELFKDLSSVVLSDFYAQLARTGNEIYQHKIQTAFETKTMVKLYHSGEFFALAKAEDFEKGSALKPIKQILI